MRFDDGTVFAAWDQVSLRDTFTDPLGELTFVARPLRSQLSTYREHLQKGNLVSVLVNDAPQGVQVIQTIEKRFDRMGGATFSVTCHTPLVAAEEGGANPDYSFASKSATTLTGIVLDLLRPYGFEEVFSDAELDVNIRAGKPIIRGKAKLNVKALKAKDLQVHEGESAYGAVVRICQIAGIAVRCDVGGRIILCIPRYDQPIAYTCVQDFDGKIRGDRFVEGVTIFDTNDDQFSECVVRGETVDDAESTYAARPQARYILESSKTAVDKFTQPVPFSKVKATTFPDDRFTYRASASVSPYKPKILRDKMGGDSESCLSVAKHVIGMRAAKAFKVTGEVDGWISDTGRIWSIDTIGRVVVAADEFDEEMWMLERVLLMDRDGSQRARLTWIPKDSLIIGNAPEGA